MTTTETLEREVRAAYNSVRNGISTRANHPTYGVTKASLFAQAYRLEGLIIAHRIVADPDCPPNPGGNLYPYAAERFDINLFDLNQRIKES